MSQLPLSQPHSLFPGAKITADSSWECVCYSIVNPTILDCNTNSEIPMAWYNQSLNPVKTSTDKLTSSIETWLFQSCSSITTLAELCSSWTLLNSSSWKGVQHLLPLTKAQLQFSCWTTGEVGNEVFLCVYCSRSCVLNAGWHLQYRQNGRGHPINKVLFWTSIWDKVT